MRLSAESTKILAKNGSDRKDMLTPTVRNWRHLRDRWGWEMPAPVTPEHEDESFVEQEAIAATLDSYIRGAQTGDVALLRLAFAETARISGTYGGKPVEWTVEEFCSLIGKGGPAKGLQAQVVSVEYAGNAGMARLEARNWRGTRYTDFFVLIKQGADWRISSKVFFAHSRA